MLKKVHSYLNFGIIFLIIALMIGVFYTVLTYDPTAIIRDISAIVSILTPEASIWLDAFIKNIDAIQQFYNIIFLSLFSVMMTFFIVIPIFNFFINRKKDLRISRLGLSVVIESLMIIFMIMILRSFIFDAYTIINIFGFLIILVILAQITICFILIYQWYKLAIERKTLGIQLINTVGFLVKVASVILIIYFTTNIAIVLFTNFAVDTLISNIHITQMIGSNIVDGLNFDVPLNELLPERVVTFFTNNGFPLTKTLSELGVTNETVGALLNSYVFVPVDGFIHTTLNNITDRFIFKDFTMKVFVLSLTIVTLIVYQIRIMPLVIRQAIVALAFTVIGFVLLVVLNYFVFINILVLLLAVIVVALIVLIVKTILQLDRTKVFLEHEKEIVQNRFKKGDN